MLFCVLESVYRKPIETIGKAPLMDIRRYIHVHIYTRCCIIVSRMLYNWHRPTYFFYLHTPSGTEDQPGKTDTDYEHIGLCVFIYDSFCFVWRDEWRRPLLPYRWANAVGVHFPRLLHYYGGLILWQAGKKSVFWENGVAFFKAKCFLLIFRKSLIALISIEGVRNHKQFTRWVMSYWYP